MMQPPSTGVSFVVPVHNGSAHLRNSLDAIMSQADGRPMEVIVVDDDSRDGSMELLVQLSREWPLTLVRGEGRGAAAALNLGIRIAQHPVICQVDQDVVIGPGWMACLVQALEEPDVAAAQGYFANDSQSGWCARVMALDLEQRYSGITQSDHVCTGNSAYRASALRLVGLFDESLGYGYDNDLSYRLREAGYRLVFCHDARSIHRWREGLIGYLLQQYGFGYGRLDLVRKYPRRIAGDTVSPAPMMLHPVLLAIALAVGLGTIATALSAGPWRQFAYGAASIVGALVVERTLAGVRAARRFRDATALAFPVLHLGRDLAWVGAMVMWSARLLSRRSRHAFHSMRPAARRAPQPRPGV